jgi:hypothetical protein
MSLRERLGMSESILEDVTAEERKFLHDISNHLVVAHGMATFAMKAIRDNPSVGEKEIERLEKSIIAINKITELLRERRSTLLVAKV